MLIFNVLYTLSEKRGSRNLVGIAIQLSDSEEEEFFGGSRNLVGIAIQLSDSEEEEFFVGYPMLISPEKFDFGIE